MKKKNTKQNFSFKPETLSLAPQMQASRVSVSISQAQAAPVPAKIGPEIGPDPGNGETKVTFDQIPTQEAPEGIRFDFAFGFRVMIPPGDKKYTVRFFDADTEIPLGVFEVKGGDTLIGERKYFIRYRMEIYSGDSKIFDYTYDCTGKRVYIAVPDGGLGDNLAWLPYVELFQKTYKADVCCIIGEWIIRLAGDLYPSLTFKPHSDNSILENSYANYFCGIFEEDKKNWRPIDHQQLGMQGTVAAILGVSREPLKCRLHRGGKRPFSEPFVCISTMATNPGKYWNYPGGWDRIIRFLKNEGYRVLDIDRDRELVFAGQKYTIPREAEDFTGRLPLQERIDLLEHADFFIGLPSGLSWLAWVLDVPVVMLSGFTMPNCEFPTPYRVTNYLYCHGCWNDSSCFFDRNVPVWCPKHAGTPREIECTKAITPKMVEDTIRRIPEFQRQQSRMREKQTGRQQHS